MKNTWLSIAALALLTITSCDKEKDDDNEPSITKESLSGSYKLTAITAKVGSFPEQDYTDQVLDDCQQDDIITLKTDFTFINADAGVKCSPAGDYTGAWGLPGNNKIQIDGEEYTIAKWDGRELHGTATETDPTSGLQAVITVKYTRQ